MTKKQEFNVNELVSFCDKSTGEKHGLRGHVRVFTHHKKTNETTLWFEDDNIIPISGYQWILMKMFGLFLDSKHGISYENLSRDTNLVIPDLNEYRSMKLGIDPENYTVMQDDISVNHFVQGFMIGNGGSGEDAITTKNTDYSFVNLRNPIPFQQTQTSLSSDIANQYLGALRLGSSSFSKSFYIKKFDSNPHIFHSWYRENQRWDYVDPVTQNDLGPDALNGVGKTNRIETYVQCQMSLSETDCKSYFEHDGNTQTASVNELGLVAFDVIPGTRSIISQLYTKKIKTFLTFIFDNNRAEDIDQEVLDLGNDILTVLVEILGDSITQTNINAFVSTLQSLSVMSVDTIDYDTLQTSLSDDSNISVTAFYDQSGVLQYTTDEFLTYMQDASFDDLTIDEAQRIKLITYYTFKPIALQDNVEILIDYRIYAN